MWSPYLLCHFIQFIIEKYIFKKNKFAQRSMKAGKTNLVNPVNSAS